jgi:hypothetical protein
MFAEYNKAFDIERFFEEFPMPEKYSHKDTRIQFLAHGFSSYSIILVNPELPPLAWTGTKWQEVKP